MYQTTICADIRTAKILTVKVLCEKENGRGNFYYANKGNFVFLLFFLTHTM